MRCSNQKLSTLDCSIACDMRPCQQPDHVRCTEPVLMHAMLCLTQARSRSWDARLRGQETTTPWVSGVLRALYLLQQTAAYAEPTRSPCTANAVLGMQGLLTGNCLALAPARMLSACPQQVLHAALP